ncbi:MAG: class I SAM-dependent methyltransferase [Gammaproteobacteria bacterium]|nr:class I SAM-dependent methyltransferase [Gammaproteobacteria bacterium]
MRTSLALAATLAASIAAADIDEKVNAALAADFRTQAETTRDANRKPLETLKFFGLSDDMHVLELFPGGGWYTKILAPVLAENGRLAVSIFTQGAAAMAEEAGWDIDVIPNDDYQAVEGTRRFTMGSMDFGEGEFDMALTFRNMHNFTDDGRAMLNAAVFKSLKAGGLYGVVDHTRRHMQPETGESWRREDPVRTIKEVQAAGFEFVDYSNLHYRPDDELRYEVGRKTVTGNTDRYTFLFRKPE